MSAYSMRDSGVRGEQGLVLAMTKSYRLQVSSKASQKQPSRTKIQKDQKTTRRVDYKNSRAATGGEREPQK